ncbi:coenzyme F420:L-glutamate ligase [archaeon]|nr:coenzyme F420:L-glutamate ligase [archaeon]
MNLEIFPILDFPLVRRGDNIIKLIVNSLEKSKLVLKNGDIAVITEKIVAKAEGRVYTLSNIKPGSKALKIAEITGKEPRLVELILRETENILYLGEGFLLVNTNQGFVCANAGVDMSNVGENRAKLLPENPDRSAEQIRKALEDMFKIRIGVIIADSFGRSFRVGSVGIAIGCSGVEALQDRRGERDLFRKELKVTRVAMADNIASMANAVMGEGSEGIPAVVIRGLDVLGEGSAGDLNRDIDKDVAFKCLKERYNYKNREV